MYRVTDAITFNIMLLIDVNKLVTLSDSPLYTSLKGYVYPLGAPYYSD